ncbi:PAB-dependent poly(A)-specific ribonuclease subunit PAN3 [Lineolata rhizophorae]|uniref:PAN2-PAN3 deadenylation complex subunit PAN3 n=1 Tax=Lineolata rhizophorae TaxID=578093 RepID=A0A6A6PF71_9PEZI|nr:PAB-dependent poly(A)-specific ribonuclease subunit PAN3 [Lineolata rhizophorae]
MATSLGDSLNDARRGVPSPRPPKGRENAKNTLCRNVTIFGHCKYANSGCAFNHDPSKFGNSPNSHQNDSAKKKFNVDSPSFTPLQPASNGASSSSRSATISPKAANAAVFTPKRAPAKTNLVSPQPQPKDMNTDWGSHDFPDFVPQTFDTSQLAADPTASAAAMNSYDPFSVSSTMAGLGGASHQASLNPYSQDAANLGGAAYFQSTNTFTQPLQYHLYAPLGPHRENLAPYQRTVHDFFIPDNLREELQRKAEATLQVLPNSTLPSVDHFHSLVPLDTTNQKNAALFGYPSWVYKAMSSQDGNYYTLRRLEGYRLTNEKAIRSIDPWKRLDNGSIVTILDAFTTRAFGDSSLIIVTDYHPLAKSLAEHHFNFNQRFQGNRSPQNFILEQVLWSYIVQIASALKTIHSHGLASRMIHPSKILLTSKNRIRLNACAVLDIVQYDNPRSITDLQQEDLVQLGRLILSLATNSPNAMLNIPKSMEQVSRIYSEQMHECLKWLLSPGPSASTPQSPSANALLNIDAFLAGISTQMASVLNASLNAEDTLLSSVNRELENSRLVRLLTKLNFVNERPEFENAPQWSETGERYYLKLFRDYVFHQVDAAGHPVIDLGHVLGVLNKLDAGTEEKIMLVSRDEQNCFVVTYKEIKRSLEMAFQDLIKASRGGR